MTFRPFTSTIVERSSTGESIGVGFRYSTLSVPVRKRGYGPTAGSPPAARWAAAAALPVEWQSMTEAMKPP